MVGAMTFSPLSAREGVVGSDKQGIARGGQLQGTQYQADWEFILRG